ncbi:hypothetical protein JKP88DRAFT_136220, partial [Tribonema minus]
LRHLEKALDESAISAILKQKKNIKHVRPDFFFVIKHNDGRVLGLHIEYDENNDHEDNDDRLKAIHETVSCDGGAFVIRIMGKHGLSGAVCKRRVINKCSLYYDMTDHGHTVANEAAVVIEERLQWIYDGLGPSATRPLKVF